MSSGGFTPCLGFVLSREGGFSNNPSDPGKATMRGITQAVYTAWLRQQGRPNAAVRGISQSDLEAIYRTQYWNLCGSEGLEKGLDLVVFDEAVNSGVGKSVRDLQTVLARRGLYTGKIDGIFGVLTAHAASNAPTSALITELCDLRLEWLHRLVNWKVFGKGWAPRVEAARAAGLTRASV